MKQKMWAVKMAKITDVESSKSSNFRKREPEESPNTCKKQKVSETIQANFIKADFT